MSNNYMPLGAKARNSIKKGEMQKHAAAKKERNEAMAFQAKMKPVWDRMLLKEPHHSGSKITAQVYANDKGYAVHLNIDERTRMIVGGTAGESVWYNSLNGIIAALEQVPAGCAIAFVFNEPGVAATLNWVEMECRYKENYINPITKVAWSNAELWRRIYELLQGQRYVSVASKGLNSPRMNDCKKALKKAPKA